MRGEKGERRRKRGERERWRLRGREEGKRWGV